MTTTFPRNLLPEEAVPWGRVMQQAVSDQERIIERLILESGNTNKQQNSSIEALQQNVQTLAVAVDRLEAISQSGYAEFSSGITAGGTGFLASPGGVSLLVPTGHLKLTYGGSLNNGQGYFVYNVTGALSGTLYNRANIQANPAQRVAVTGGASFTPSGSTSVLVNVPTNQLISVSLELYSGLTGTYFAGGSILAEVAP